MTTIFNLDDYRNKPETPGAKYTHNQMQDYARSNDCVYHRPGGAARIDLWLGGKLYCIKQDDSQSSQMSVYVDGRETRMWWYADTVHGCEDSKLADAIHATCASYWAIRDSRKDKVYLMCDIWPYVTTRPRKRGEA